MKGKRFVSGLLAVCLLVGLGTVPAYAAKQVNFRDVQPTDWYYTGVQDVCQRGLMNGTGEGMFSPSQSTTRGMIVTIIHRVEGSPEPVSPNTFADVAAGTYYEKAVAWAAENGIVTGYSAAQFGPNDAITRQQMATILYRYANTCGYDTFGRADLTGYRDYGTVGGYAVTPMSWAVGVGLITGTAPDTLSPQGFATRAQVAIILSRFCSKFQNQDEPTPEQPPEIEDPDLEEELPEKPEVPPAPEQPDYPGIAADQADSNAPNLFLLSAEASADGKTVDVTLVLCGAVNLCGFDLQLGYDKELFSVKKVDTNCDLQVFASSQAEGVNFNYSGANNITKEKTVLKVTFDVLRQWDTQTAFFLHSRDVIWTDVQNGYAVEGAAHTLTYCGIEM